MNSEYIHKVIVSTQSWLVKCCRLALYVNETCDGECSLLQVMNLMEDQFGHIFVVIRIHAQSCTYHYKFPITIFVLSLTFTKA